MMVEKTLIVTGACGFIGSAFARIAVDKGYRVIVLDALTYSGHRESITGVKNTELVVGNICDRNLVTSLFEKYQPQALLNFAAESHVDRSIDGPSAFIETNINGTFNLLSCANEYFKKLSAGEKGAFRFLQVSTDEVFGSLGDTGKFTEETPYAPNSPYSASKAAADHLARAWFHTYKLPTLITNCSNNYGPRQFPEKLIPLMIQKALRGEGLPVYGTGANVRDWIHVEDHSRGILLALEKGRLGEAYCFGGNAERKNLDVVHAICKSLDSLHPRKDGKPHTTAIQYVQDRPGHDWRYAIDDTKAARELGFSRQYSFESGIDQTVKWYLENDAWVAAVTKNDSSAHGRKGVNAS